MIENEISFASIVDIQGFQMNKDSIAYCLKITTGNKVIFFRVSSCEAIERNVKC